MSAMVRLKKLLNAGCEVTFLPGSDPDGDGARSYEVHVVTAEGHGYTAEGPSPQETLLRASRMRSEGYQVTYAQSSAGGWFADLRDASGRSTAAGYGRSQAEALARMLGEGQADDDDGLEPFCGECQRAIGIFYGHEGWQHYAGEGTVASPVELYDAGHEPAVAWRERAAGFTVAAPSPLPWVMAEDGRSWRAELPDGRSALIERLVDGNEDGSGAVFVPSVHESSTELERGPEFGGLMDAGKWVLEHLAAAQDAR